MRLSKLKLAGFKSFVDPTTLLTPGQLVGIVGPNGCGKSNVIDAVRWVLGETRASALRGESMQDVIFNGSTSRKPVSRASVELVFDNADGKAAGQWGQYAEISVKRVVDRSGDSEYLINNVRVRRKDVIDLFLGTGLGPRAYAIIEQGMISRVIEARPEEVRAFLEEAAGITKYKERRRETEGRLSDARDNLARIEDIRAELGHQIERLNVQAEVAGRYRALQESLNQRQVLLWVYKREQAKAEHQRASEAITRLAAALEQETERARVLETRVAAARETHARFSEAAGVAQGEVYAAAAEVSRLESELRNLREARQSLEQRIAQLGGAEGQWRDRANALAQELAHWQARREADTQALVQAREAARQAEQALQPAEAAWREAQTELDQLRRELSQTEQHIQVQLTREQAARRSLEALGQRRARLEQEQQALPVPDRAAIERAEAAAQARRNEVDALQAAVARQQGEAQGLLQAWREAQEAERTANRQLTEKRARLEALQGLQARLRDQGDVPSWMNVVGLSGQPPLWQSLEVDAGWELAVEAVLRERVAALGPFRGPLPHEVLVHAAPATIALLREDDADHARQTAAVDFAATPLLSHVRSSEPALQAFLARWLNNVFAVDDLAPWLLPDATAPAGAVLVSKSGALLSRDCLTLFAPDARTHGVIERQREIEALKAEVAALTARQHALHAAVLAAETAHHQGQDALVRLRHEHGEAMRVLHAVQVDLVQAREAEARQRERSEQLAGELAEVARAEQAETLHLGEAASATVAGRERKQHVEAQTTLFGAELAAREQDLKRCRDELATRTQARHQAEMADRESASRLEELTRNRALTDDQLNRSGAELADLLRQRDALIDDDTLRSLQTALDMRAARENALSGLRNQLETALNEVRQLDEERLRTERALDPLREELNTARLAQQAAELALQQALERLVEMSAEQRHVPPEELAEVRETALSREVARLTREIAELGPVNLAALAELQTASDRKHFLDAQYADLMQAIGTLEDAIRRIDRETREQLQDTYNTVNRHFGELFPQLFGGGEAALILSGEEILDAGVQIVARPPGKKNTSIHLLSGGEKALTAIALVFAMFQLNPAPFCMLDEVDAPLDDTNTERYCEMVKRMSAVTQFVFISHSKITMEMARQLIGVTMQEQGVSRVVEVDIEEALKLAQPLAA